MKTTWTFGSPQALPLQMVKTSRFKALLVPPDKTKFAAETTVAGGSAPKASPFSPLASPVMGPPSSPPKPSFLDHRPENAFELPTERAVTATIPYNATGAKPTGTSLFLHGRIEDTRVFGAAPHIQYLEMEEGIRLPRSVTQRLDRVVTCSLTSSTVAVSCFYDSYPIAPGDRNVPCPVDYDGRAMSVTGSFCSEACVLAYMQEGRAGTRASMHGPTWLAMLRRMRGEGDNDLFVDRALHFSILERFGGPMSIDEYRKRGEPRTGYRRRISYVFPQNFRLVPTGYIHVREDRAQAPQQQTSRLLGDRNPGSAKATTKPPGTPQSTGFTASSPLNPSSSTPVQLPLTSPVYPQHHPVSVAPPQRRRLKRRIETSDDEGHFVLDEPGGTDPGSTATANTSDYYRIRRVEQTHMGRRKRHYQNGDADANHSRKTASKRRKRAMAKQLTQASDSLRRFLQVDEIGSGASSSYMPALSI